MSSFPQFANTVAKYKIKKSEYIVHEARAGLRIHPLGFSAGKVFYQASALRPLFQDMLTRLPFTADGAQPIIGVTYGKITSLAPHLQKSIEMSDKTFPSSIQCGALFKKALELIDQVQQYVPYLSNSSAPTMTQHMETISQNITTIIECFDTIIGNTVKYDTVISSKIKPMPASQVPLATSIAAALIHYELLFIDLIFVGSLEKIKESKENTNVVKTLVMKVREFSDKLFAVSRSESQEILLCMQGISSILPKISNQIGQLQVSLPNLSDFSKLAVSMVSAIQATNELIVKLQLKSVMDVMKNIVSSFLNKKPMDGLIQIGKQMLNSMEDLICSENSCISTSTKATFNTLKAMLEVCSSSPELSAITLISICRFVAINFPDAQISEDLLISLTQKITMITKTLFKESKDIINKLSETIADNLEYFSERPLSEVNYFMVAAKSITIFNPEAEDFVITQQLIFDCISAIPTPLMKLIAQCTDASTKHELTIIIKQIQPLATRFAQWLNQYYTSLVSIVHLRSDAALSVLRYPIYCIHGQNQEIDNQLVRVQSTINTLQTILASTPQNLTFDFGDVMKLIKQLQDLSDSGNDFIKIVSTMSSSSSYYILHIAAQTLTKIGVPLPIPVQVIPSLLNFEDRSTFVAGMLSNLSRALLLSKDIEPKVNNGDAKASFYFSCPFTFILTADAMISAAGSYGTSLVSNSAPLRSSLDVVWGITNQIATGQNPPEASHLPTYASTIIKTTSDLFNAACALPQPTLTYKIPKNLKEIKQYDDIASKLPSSALKQFSPVLLRILKRGKSQEARNMISAWFEQAQNQSGDLMKLTESFVKAATAIYDSGKPDAKAFNDNLAKLSVSLAVSENMFGKIIAPSIASLHTSILEAATKYLDNPKDMSLLLNVIQYVLQIKSYPELSKLKLKDLDTFTQSTVTKIIKALHAIRKSGKNLTKNTVTALKNLKALEAFYTLYPNPNGLKVQSTIDLLVNGNPKKSALNEAIAYFTERLNILVPLLFNAIDRIRDTDAIIDLSYDKADIFRDETAKIIKLASDKGSEEAFNSSANALLLSVADVAVLAYHAINLAKLKETALSQTLSMVYADLQKSVYQFVQDANKVRGGKSSDTASLKGSIRGMTKELDRLIAIVEAPQFNEPGKPGKFRQMQYSLYSQMEELTAYLAYLCELTTTSVVPEMYTAGRTQFQDLFTNGLDKFSEIAQDISKQCAGESASKFQKLIDTIKKQGNAIISSAQSVKSGEDAFPVSSVMPDIISFPMSGIAKIVPDLSDNSSSKSDPEAASKVPDDYIVPQSNREPTAQSAAWDSLQTANNTLLQQIKKFRQVIEEGNASSERILKEIKEFRYSCDKFGEAAITMSVSTPDLKSRIYQQSSLYSWGSNVTNVQNAVRSRFLKAAGYEEEMKESLDMLTNSMLKIMKLGEEASKIVIESDEESLDEVTKQLITTTRDVDAIVTRFASLESKVSTEGIVQEKEKKSDKSKEEPLPNIEDPTKYELLPGFLIICGKIILKASSVIVNRARELTNEVISKMGHVTNEQGIIKGASDVSEAAKLLMIVVDLLIAGKDDEIDYKIIAAARIINGAIASLFASVGVKGGDSEGVMNKQVKTVKRYTDQIIKVVERFVDYKITEQEKNEPKKTTNPMIMRLNMQQRVNEQRKVLEEAEKKLYLFRRKQ